MASAANFSAAAIALAASPLAFAVARAVALTFSSSRTATEPSARTTISRSSSAMGQLLHFSDHCLFRSTTRGLISRPDKRVRSHLANLHPRPARTFRRHLRIAALYQPVAILHPARDVTHFLTDRPNPCLCRAHRVMPQPGSDTCFQRSRIQRCAIRRAVIEHRRRSFNGLLKHLRAGPNHPVHTLGPKAICNRVEPLAELIPARELYR